MRSTDGAAVTTIKGVADHNGPYPNDYVGCGPNSVRGVHFASGDGKRHALQGFTIADCHSRADDYTKDIESDRGGALCGAGTVDLHAVLDCVITNCSSVRATMYCVWATRCKFYDCTGYGGVMRSTRLSGCFVDPSCKIGTGGPGAAANRVLGNDTAAYLCTLPNCSLWNNCRYYNSLFGKLTIGSGDVLYGSAATNFSNMAVADAAAMGIVCVTDPGFVDPSNGDWRLYGPTPVRYKTLLPESGSLAYGTWMTNFTAYATTGLSGEPISSTDGVPLAGCHQDTENGVIYIGADKGGLAITGGTTGYSPLTESLSVTVAPGAGTRPCIGYTVNGVTNLFDETPSRTFTAADAAAGEYGLSLDAIYTRDWYVSPSGSDANPGGTRGSPFGTLAYAMTKAVEGDTVHAAEGVYGEGSATRSATPGLEHASRVIVGKGVTLVADGAAENTIILGAFDTSATANAYEMGTNALRCVYVSDYATVKGFTITGGRTRYDDRPSSSNNLEWDGSGNWAGGGVQGSSSGRDRAFVVDCIISNCVACYGGGASMVNLVRCRVFDCRALNHGGGACLVNMYGSLIDRCSSNGGGANINDFTRIYNSTIGPNGYNLSGTPRVTISMGSSGAACLINCLILGGSPGNAGAMTNPACHTVFADTSLNYPTDGTTRVVSSADLAVDGDLRPIPGLCAAVDAGSGALLTDFSATDASAQRFLPYASDRDLSGAPRITNGSLDPGALEANWLPQYAKTLGGARTKIVVDEAGSRVVDDGSGKITIPDGESLALTWGDATMRGVRKATVRVTGAGTLTVTVGGEPYASLTAADGEQTFSFLSKNLSAYDFGFAFAGEGSATLSGFDFVGGMMITIR